MTQANEAGLGSSAIVHGETEADAVTGGLCGAFESFADMIIALISAFCILLSGVNSSPAAMTADAFGAALGSFGSYFIVFALLIFALSSMPCWYYYGVGGLSYLTNKKSAHRAFTVLYICIIAIAPLLNLEHALEVSDSFNVLLIVPSLLSVMLFLRAQGKVVDR